LETPALKKQLQGVCLGKQQKGCFVISKLRENLQYVLARYLGIGQLIYFPNLKMHLKNSITFAGNLTSHQEI